MRDKYIIIDAKDNCATALEDIPQNTSIQISSVVIKINQNIPFGHKFALEKIEKDMYVIKYGEKMGIATEVIYEGDWIHTHNIKSPYLEESKNG
jgi:hypothetical protein